MGIVFNPINADLKDVSLDLNFYYTGAQDVIYMRYQEEEEYTTLKLVNGYEYTLTFDIGARGISYWTFIKEDPQIMMSEVPADTTSLPFVLSEALRWALL